jgi:hypothetical protein
MAGALTAAIAAAFSGGGSPPVTTDPYFEYTTLLLPGNGTNGAQNNTFLDASTNNFTITRNGNTTQGTFSPFSQTGWGAYFDGSSDYIQYTNSDFSVSTGDFTAEWWMYVTSDKSQVGIMTASSNSNLTIGYGSGSANARQPYIEWGGSGVYVGTLSNYANKWTHVCVMRSSGTVYTFQDGGLLSSTSKSAAVGSTANMVIGTNSGDIAGQSFPGYLSNVRFAKAAVYSTSGFTPSTTPLTRTSQGATNVQFLTLQSNRFLDSDGVNIPAASPLTITKNGDTSVQAFSPFNPSASWSAATYGGSGYFDGTGDYLTAASNAAFTLDSTGDFTVECWIYPTAAFPSSPTAPAYILASQSDYNSGFTNRWALVGTGSTIGWFNSAGSYGIQTSSLSLLNTWTHIAVVRSGSTITMYINGTSVGTQTLSQAYTTQSGAYVGFIPSASAFTGYISNARVVKGTAVYTSAFTPPTAPLTAITNTSLLLNYTNAGIYDATSKNDLETVGNAQISTAISAKWGSGSMYFDGTGDYLVWPSSQTLIFGTADFTIEMWVNRSSTQNSVSTLFAQSPGSTYFVIHNNDPSYVNRITVYVDNYGAGTRVLTGGTTLSADTWYHVALTRASGVWRLFINGTSDSSTYTNTANPTPSGSVNLIGARSTSSPLPFTGYIQDARITTGYARYTSNFTAPTAAFPTL